jgi:hypothetical protein
MPPGARPVKIHSYANDIKAASIVKAEFFQAGLSAVFSRSNRLTARALSVEP